MLEIETILIFLTVSLTTYYFVNYLKTKRVRELASKLPGHNGLSLLSSIYITLKTKRTDYVPRIFSFIKSDHPMTKIWFLNKLLIITKDADFIHKIFNSQKVNDKPKLFYQGFPVEKALLVMSGADHKRHRKILNKAFKSSMLELLPAVFDEKSKKILDLMMDRVDCGEFELTEYVGAYSFEALGKSHFNYEMEYFKSDIVRAYESFCSLIIDTLPFLMIGLKRIILNFTKLGKHLTQTENEFQTFFDKVVCNAHKQNSNDKIENSFVDLLLDPKNNFDKQEVREELIFATLGVFETTTRTISTALMMIGMHKNVQDKAFKEIEDIYSQEVNTEFTVDFLQKFKYLELILKETLRLFAVVPVVARETSEEVTINGYLIPKNTSIIISIHAMHRDEKYWGNDADKFRPERFEEELKNPHAWMPFTDGSRICIGYRYAMMSMKAFLINFLRRYNVSCATKLEDLETEMTFTLNIVNGYKAGICSR